MTVPSQRLASTAPVIDALDAHLDALGFMDGPYFRAIGTPGYPLRSFISQQLQFKFAVHGFAQPLALLVGRIPTPEQRMRVLRNVVEEHGGFDGSRTHKQTFRLFLERLGVSPAEIDAPTPGVAVDAFNASLVGLCFQESWVTAAAALGTIEAMFSRISAFIARIVVQQGWLPAEQLVHYDLHAELDVEHAYDLMTVSATAWETPEGNHAVMRGIRLGAYYFNRLYADLLEVAP